MIREKTPHQIEIDRIAHEKFLAGHTEMVNRQGNVVHVRSEDVDAMKAKGCQVATPADIAKAKKAAEDNAKRQEQGDEPELKYVASGTVDAGWKPKSSDE